MQYNNRPNSDNNIRLLVVYCYNGNEDRNNMKRFEGVPFLVT